MHTRDIIVGVKPNSVEHTEHYFAERHCFIDCRGEISISKDTVFGFGVMILSMSHDITNGVCGAQKKGHVKIDGNSWIASFAQISNCWVQHHAVIAGGCVLSGVIVPEYSMVMGNPGKVVSRYNQEVKKWERLATPLDCEKWCDRYC